MRIIVMVTSLVLCLSFTFANPASARHRRHHQPAEPFVSNQYFDPDQPQMMAGPMGPDLWQPRPRRLRAGRGQEGFAQPTNGAAGFAGFAQPMEFWPEPRPVHGSRRTGPRLAKRPPRPTAGLESAAQPFQGPSAMGAGPEANVMASRGGRMRASRTRRAFTMGGGIAHAPNPSGAMGFGDTSLVAEARRWIGGNPTGRSSLWCGNFMNFVLERTGHPASPSNTARSFASYGRRIPGPQVGAIAVMGRRGRGGHVGVVSGIDPSGNPIIISGNHGRRVAESVYPRGRIYAYVMP